MSEFFDSDVVQDSLEEIQELQNSIQDAMMKYNFLNFWQQKEKLEEL